MYRLAFINGSRMGLMPNIFGTSRLTLSTAAKSVAATAEVPQTVQEEKLTESDLRITTTEGDPNDPELQWKIIRREEDLPPPPKEGPERDLVNFPRLPRPINPGKVRWNFIPEEWFQFFYSKTGVTGPYVFGLTTFTFLASKEYYVFEHEFYTGLSYVIIWAFAYYKFGPAIRKYFDKENDDEERIYKEWKANEMAVYKTELKAEEKFQWQNEGQLMLLDAKKENIGLQLEASYRERLKAVHDAVKNRLDYYANVEDTKKRVQQKNASDWIIRNVLKSITPQQEKEALQKCIADLKNLASKPR